MSASVRLPAPLPSGLPTVPAAQQAPPADEESRGDRAAGLLGWATLLLVLGVGIPVFLCMPVGFDSFHYDICARNVLRGGVHYRDVFDNNLPGIVWIHLGLRWLFGWWTETFHAADLLSYSACVALLLRWARPGTRVWAAAGLYAFYLFLPESCPGQRDEWMLLPAVVGLTLRRRQVGRMLLPPAAPLASLVWPAILEGLCWGAAVWIKPFAFVPALACWLVGLLQVRKARTGALRPLAADTAGLLAGGLLAGALGLAWLWQSGSWPYFWDILLGWNRDYGAFAHKGQVRFNTLFIFLVLFLPWSLVPLAAAYLAVRSLRSELGGGPATAAAAGAAPGHALLSAFFLGWVFQAVFLQLPHQYVLAPTVVPGVILIAGLYRWRQPSRVGAVLWLSSLALLAFLWSLTFQLHRVTLWARCCREGCTPQLRSLLCMRKETAYAVDSAALADVEAYLAGQGAGDGEVTCLSGCTHPLYLDLNLTPTTRFPQIEMTALFFASRREGLVAELNASRQRFVVSDLVWAGLTPEEARETNPDDPLALPSTFPEKFALMYPWREPIVFRSGRYLVHRVTGTADRFWVEDQEDEARPAKSRYVKFFAGNQSFRDEARARQSVAVIDDLYRRFAAAGDRAGQHAALRQALLMCERARAAGHGPEADVFRRWLERRLDGQVAAPPPAPAGHRPPG